MALFSLLELEKAWGEVSRLIHPFNLNFQCLGLKEAGAWHIKHGQIITTFSAEVTPNDGDDFWESPPRKFSKISGLGIEGIVFNKSALFDCLDW